MLSDGRCSQDDCSITPIRNAPYWMTGREGSWLVSAVPLKNFRLCLGFRDGTVRIANMTHAFSTSRSLQILLSRENDFRNIRITGSGRVLDWGAQRFMMSADLYRMGRKLPLDQDDIHQILKSQLLDTSDITRTHNVSRQYINRLFQDQGIQPFRKCGANNLYLRDETSEIFDT